MMKQKNQKFLKGLFLILVVVLLGAPQAMASGLTVYKDGDKYVELGGRIQMQYHYTDTDGGDTVDEVFFRRLRPYIEGSLHKDWMGRFQWDMGKADGENEIAIKDAYMQYKGLPGVKVTVGNANFPFSRELLTSSKRQQLVERTFVGDHNYGTPDRQLGVHLTGAAMDKKLTWGASFAQGAIDPDTEKLDFDTLANKNGDFNEGWMYGARVDFHPFGYLKMAQGDFNRELKATIGLAAFGWDNDDDNNTYTDNGITNKLGKSDIDSVTGFEISGAVRVAGLSVDAQYNLFNAETIDSSVTSGLYKNGETDLESYALEGGYMIVPETLELVAGYELQDADNYTDEWTRTSFGANYFIKDHDIKLQATYRIGENLKGASDTDEDEFFLQAQYVF